MAGVSLLLFLLFFIVLIFAIWAVVRIFKIKDLNKIYKWMMSIFVVYLLISILILLDFEPINLIDYGEAIEMLISSLMSLSLLIGIIIGFVILYNADNNFEHIRGTKWFIFLFYLFSPLVFFVVSGISDLQGIGITVLSTLPILLTLLFVYFFDITWSRSKRIAFGIYYFIIGVAFSVLTWGIALLGMSDRAMS
ncbi:MAG: hypothetical protein Q8L27_01735 [archaeon]|nr:hypothetical protein [archaeon]